MVRPRLILSDDFSNADEGVFIEDEGTDSAKLSSGSTLECQWQYAYSGGALVARVTGAYPKAERKAWCGSSANTDDTVDELPSRLAVEVRAKATKSSGAAYYGIRIDSWDGKTSYEFVVSPADGTYGISHYAGTWSWIANAKSSAIKKGSAENLLRLEIRDSTLVALVNGQEVSRLRRTDLPLDVGSAALEFMLGGQPADKSVEVRFTDLKVYSPEP